MGQTIRTLAAKPLKPDVVFSKRFVIEICEAVHVHYRNLRILTTLEGFQRLAVGFKNSLERWGKLGSPETARGSHIELCRLTPDPIGDDMVRINLNRNLYPEHEGRIFSEGAEIKDPEYIHVKIRDLRLEFSQDDFCVIADAFTEAKSNLIKPCSEPDKA